MLGAECRGLGFAADDASVNEERLQLNEPRKLVIESFLMVQRLNSERLLRKGMASAP